MKHITRASDALTVKIVGPFAILRSCRLCEFRVSRRRGGGRGAGFREGNKQRGEMHQHMKAEHPNAMAETYQILADDGWQSLIPHLPIAELKGADQ